MHVRWLPGIPQNPLEEEIWTQGITRLLNGEEITEVQRQVLHEWIEQMRAVNDALFVILKEWDSRLKGKGLG